MSSEYFKGLKATAQERYLAKLDVLKIEDPYALEMEKLDNNVQSWPKVENMDIINYLVFSTCQITKEQMKNYKSLKSYGYFIDGMVSNIKTKTFGCNILVIAKVRHSQKANEKPLQPWVVCDHSGKVLNAHCDCMAGLGESCLHVGAVLFALEAGNRMSSVEASTERSCQWIMPPTLKKVVYLEVRDINFDTPEVKKREMENPQPPTVASQPPCQMHLSKNVFLDSLSLISPKSAILSVISQYGNSFSSASEPSLPAPLTSLFDHNLMTKTYEELVTFGEKYIFKINEENINAVEATTRDQKYSKEWFRQRAGRITASRMKACCSTTVDMPSLSLLKQVCYPQQHAVNTHATKWGCDHEREAYEQYGLYMQTIHTNFKIRNSGLIISKEKPYIGASPDGLIECDCCSNGVIEIKCPYCFKSKALSDLDLTELKAIGLDKDKLLSHNHSYYYQIQTQMAVTNSSYGDFVIWTEKSLQIERIAFQEEFWSSASLKAEKFFFKVIFPELSACYFTNKSSTRITVTTKTKKQV